MDKPKQGTEIWPEKYLGTNHKNYSLAKLNKGTG